MMRNCVRSVFEEIGAMLSGHFVPYHKTALLVATVTAVLFSIVYSHGVVFEAPIAVVDLDNSRYSTELIEKVNTSPYIRIETVVHSPVDLARLTAHDRTIGILYIPRGLEKSIKTGDRTVKLGYFADNSNEAQNAEVLANLGEYIPELGAEVSAGRVAALGLSPTKTQAALMPMQLKNRYLFNPTNAMTNATSIAFVYFFSSLFYGLTTLMIVGRLKVTGLWRTSIVDRGLGALIARIVPYALFYTGGITIVSACLIVFGQLRFAGNWFFYVPSIFMTGMSFGLLALLMGWSTQNPGQGASRMIFLVPPGFILGGATSAAGYLPSWAYDLSYIWPLTWQYRFFRDFSMRGESLTSMAATYGAYVLYMTVLAMFLAVLFYRAKRTLVHEQNTLETMEKNIVGTSALASPKELA